MACSLHCLLLLVALCAIGVHAAVFREEKMAQIFGQQGRTATVITVVTSTATGATTTTIKKRLVCALLEGSTPSTACRRKRQFWNAPFMVAPLYIGQDHSQQQFEPLHPTQVVQVEPSVLPEYRSRPVIHRLVGQHQFASPYAIQPSFEKTPSVVPAAAPQFRIPDPFFGAARFSAFSSLFSNIISSILTPAVTSTSTKVVYTKTSTATSFTATTAYTLKNAQCLPAGVTTCPAAATTTAATTTRRK